MKRNTKKNRLRGGLRTYKHIIRNLKYVVKLVLFITRIARVLNLIKK